MGYTRAAGEDPLDVTYAIEETTVNGISVGDKVTLTTSDLFTEGEDPTRTLTVKSFFVSYDVVYAGFNEPSAISGIADMSAPVENLARAI